MELKKEDFILMRNYQDREFLALRKDFFDEEEELGPIGSALKARIDEVKKVFETKEAVEVEIPIPEPAPSDLETNPPPDPLAKARAAKAAKRDALKAELEALE